MVLQTGVLSSKYLCCTTTVRLHQYREIRDVDLSGKVTLHIQLLVAVFHLLGVVAGVATHDPIEMPPGHSAKP